MDLKFLKWHLIRGSLMKRVVLRAFMLVLAVIVVSLTQLACEVRIIEPVSSNLDECTLNLGSNPEFNLTDFLNSAPNFALPFLGAASCKHNENLTKAVLKELIMEKYFFRSNAKSLCVGENSASAVLALRHWGFFDAYSVDSRPSFSLSKRRFVCDLGFEDNHFDFMFSEDLDRVPVPSLLVMEMERVLRPGGTGAMLVGSPEFYSGGGTTAAATTAASFLKSSDVVHACRIGCFKLVIFKKRLEGFASFDHFKLPSRCPSVENNAPFMKYIEPLRDDEPSYLPNFMNISSRSKMVYINVGVGEYARTSVAKMTRSYCGDHHAAFEVFIIDHKTSVLSSYVTDPGINFVYHPALAGEAAAFAATPEADSDELFGAPADEEGFEFVSWFKETVSDGDFVVLMMRANQAEMNILVELFRTGEICRVDEIFLECSNCTNLIESLRKSGLYVHQQWLGS